MIYPSFLAHNRGMTLAELLISTIIVGIMVAGIFSSYYALQAMDRGASRRAGVAIELQSVSEHLRHNALMMTGTLMNIGLAINNSADNFNYLCFRQDIALTPENLADDQWACYTRLGAFRVNVHFCTGAAPTFCVAGDDFIGRSFFDTPGVDTTTGTFNILLVNRFDPSAGIDGGPGDPTQGDENNPQAFYRLSVHPDAHSFR